MGNPVYTIIGLSVCFSIFVLRIHADERLSTTSDKEANSFTQGALAAHLKETDFSISTLTEGTEYDVLCERSTNSEQVRAVEKKLAKEGFILIKEKNQISVKKVALSNIPLNQDSRIALDNPEIFSQVSYTIMKADKGVGHLFYTVDPVMEEGKVIALTILDDNVTHVYISEEGEVETILLSKEGSILEGGIEYPFILSEQHRADQFSELVLWPKPRLPRLPRPRLPRVPKPICQRACETICREGISGLVECAKLCLKVIQDPLYATICTALCVAIREYGCYIGCDKLCDKI